jgi:hypothetical protein
MFFESGLPNDTTVANRMASENALFGSSEIINLGLEDGKILGAYQRKQRSDQCGCYSGALGILHKEGR